MVINQVDLTNRENLKLHQVQLEIMQISLEIGNFGFASIRKIILFRNSKTWSANHVFSFLGIPKQTRRISMKMTQRIIVEDQA